MNKLEIANSSSAPEKRRTGLSQSAAREGVVRAPCRFLRAVHSVPFPCENRRCLISCSFLPKLQLKHPLCTCHTPTHSLCGQISRSRQNCSATGRRLRRPRTSARARRERNRCQRISFSTTAI